MRNKLLRQEKAITLIALVVTIVVLIILATVSINAVMGDDGLIQKAEKASQMQANAEAVESEAIDELYKDLANALAKTEVIDTTTSYVGYYADIDGDKEPDGVIYADLAVAVSGQWYNSNGAFSYEAITGTKDYYVSKTDHEGDFGTKDVLTATGSGADRFYVMALDDFNAGTYYCWYDAGKISDYSTVTSTDFGKGKTNTATMIGKWNSSTYGAQNDNSTYADMWGVIQDKVKEGWFVPSRGEWGAFANNLGITSSNYSNYGLSTYCWSSSPSNTRSVWFAFFNSGCMGSDLIDSKIYVRLSATF